MIKKTNVENLERAKDSKSLYALLQKAETNKVRDPYIFFDWTDSEGGKFQAGYSVLYPGCRSGGHEHNDAEEVYFVVSGSGVMHIGDESFEICAGDSWVVPLYLHHWTDNPGNNPLELFWIVVKL